MEIFLLKKQAQIRSNLLEALANLFALITARSFPKGSMHFIKSQRN